MTGGEAGQGAGEEPTPDTVASLAQLYLGNILFALERCAMSLDNDGKKDDAAFYRGIARQLAEAHGKARSQVGGRRAE